MPIPDFTDLTLDELRQAIEQLNAVYAAKIADAATEVDQRRAAVAGLIDAYTAVLGPEGAAPGEGSIRAIRAFDAADIAAGKPRGTTMVENAALSLSKLYEGMEIIAAAGLNMAHLAAKVG